MRERPTIDIIVILLTGIVGFCLILIVIGILALKLMHPETEPGKAGEAVGNILQIIVGALVGLIGGRAAGRLEANGAKTSAAKE